MSESLVLLAPAANHVYAGQAGRLCAAELSLTCPNATSVAPV
ncbi:site-specific DNA-methyltransferase, partial [Cutibacterium acnes subsp. acnes]|nr:site-specific DNA-methyltransferase [Cutibacterium acnes subsp. acnes]